MMQTYTTATASAMSTDKVTLQAMDKAIRELDRLRPRPSVDAWVCTPDTWEELRRYLWRNQLLDPWLRWEMNRSRICGIPVWIEPNAWYCLQRWLELRDAGIRVRYLEVNVP